MLSLSASLILLTDYLEVGTVVLIVAELVAVVAICVAGVPPRRLHGDAASAIPLEEPELEQARLST